MENRLKFLLALTLSFSVAYNLFTIILNNGNDKEMGF